MSFFLLMMINEHYFTRSINKKNKFNLLIKIICILTYRCISLINGIYASHLESLFLQISKPTNFFLLQEKDNEILSFNNELSGLQTRLDTAQSEAVKWENEWTRIKNTSAEKTLELGRIKM